MSSSILKPNAKLPEFKTATILLVGAEGTGKHELAKAILSLNPSVAVHIRTVTSLPLSEEDEDSRPRIDFICFIVDLTNRESMRVVEESIKFVDSRFFLGKVCFVALKVKCPEKRGVDIEILTDFCEHYNSPILYAELEEQQDKVNLAKQVFNLAKISSGLVPNVSSLLIDSSKKPYGTLLL